MPKLWLVRHGETEWSASGRHTSTTDIDLTDAGVAAAERLRPVLAAETFALVLSSPRRRARRTAEIAGFEAEVDDDLAEWAYGDYEGLTIDAIRQSVPGWTVWTHPSPGGESAAQVGERLDRVIGRVRAVHGDVLVFAHGHCLRALAARWLGQPVEDGRLLRLDTATTSVLGKYRETAVIERWNCPLT